MRLKRGKKKKNSPPGFVNPLPIFKSVNDLMGISPTQYRWDTLNIKKNILLTTYILPLLLNPFPKFRSENPFSGISMVKLICINKKK